MKKNVIKLLLLSLPGIFLLQQGFASTLSFKSISLIRAYEMERELSGGEKDFFAPYYQYLDIEFKDIETKGIIVKLNGWGNLQLGDYYFQSGTGGRLSALDLNYGYIDLGGPQATTRLILGRQFVYAGVISSEQIDGGQFQIRMGPYGIAGYLGIPVQYEYDDRSEDLIGGGRVYYLAQGIFDVGVSAVYALNNGELDKEWVGIDGWFQPYSWLEFNGRLYYSPVDKEIYDSSFIPTFKPSSKLQITLKYLRTIPSEFLSKSTIFSVFSTDAVDEYGTKIGYDIIKNFTIWADFSYFKYDGGLETYMYGLNPRFKYGPKLNNFISLVLRRHETEENAFNEVALFFRHNILSPAIEFGLNTINFVYDHLFGLKEIKYSSSHNIFFGYFFRPNLELLGNAEALTSYEGEIEYRGLIKLNYEFDGYLVR